MFFENKKNTFNFASTLVDNSRTHNLTPKVTLIQFNYYPIYIIYYPIKLTIWNNVVFQ